MAWHRIDNNTWLNDNEYEKYKMSDRWIGDIIGTLFGVLLFVTPAYELMTIFCSWIELPSWAFWVGLAIILIASICIIGFFLKTWLFRYRCFCVIFCSRILSI